MSPLARLHPTTEGLGGSRIDLEGGGRYLGIPRPRSLRAFVSAKGTGWGTRAPSPEQPCSGTAGRRGRRARHPAGKPTIPTVG